MDNVTERAAREATDQRREAFAQAQKSGSNVYWFRRLKWGAPRPTGRVGRKPALGVIEIMLCVVIVASLGFAAVTLWLH